MTQASALAQSLRAAVSDERVLAAIASIPRERFVPPAEQDRAYENVALPIDCGQTISQPLVVARMLEILSPGPEDRVLDVGTGSGYHAALLALLGEHVWTIERHGKLAEQAQRAIDGLGLSDRVTFVVGDGWRGLPEEAPFDAINVAAASRGVPQTLEEQLATGGRLVTPIGARNQNLVLTCRGRDGFERTTFEPVRFVPLVRG